VTRWVVAGAGGMLGRDMSAALAERDVRALTRDELDVTDLDACRAAVAGAGVVVNCAAWTAVDAAESQESAAFAVNALGAAHLARACAEQGAWLVHVSTDYVFGGRSSSPYAEQAPLAPRSAYGRTKAAGEWAVQALLPGRHHLVRTAWLYGNEGPSFVHAMLALAGRPEEPLSVVDDQHGQPTWTVDVAGRVVALVESAAPSGTYHATSSGVASWYDLAVAVLAAAGADPGRVQRASTAAVPRPAPRPAWSVLGHDAWASCGLDPIEHWRPRLHAFLVGRG
jgi:dTDP-4-dehydrorhamnose reductase